MPSLSNYPNARPSIILDFANSAMVDPRIAVSRATIATRTNAKGMIETVPSNVARIDYDPVTGECLGLLTEESRTNDVIQSEFATGLLNGVYGNVSATTFPGFAGGVSIQYNAAGAYAYKTVTPLVQGTAYSFSFLVLMDDGGDATVNDFTVVLSGGAIANPTIKKLGGGLHLVQASGSAGGANTSYGVVKYPNQSTRGLKVTAYDRQTGTFPTSYIPTTTAAATRAGDLMEMLGTNFSEWFKPEAGTMLVVCDMIGRRPSGFEAAATISAGGSSGNLLSVGAQNSGNAGRAIAITNSEIVADFRSGTPTVGQEFKMAFAYGLNDFATSYNGGAALLDTDGVLPLGLSRLVFGVEGNGGSRFSGHIRRFAYYPTRLTNAQLQALTTI